MSDNTERLILRKTYDPYMGMKKFVAIYPDEPAWHGCLACQPFYFRNDGSIVVEPYSERNDAGLRSRNIFRKKKSIFV